MQRRAPRFFTLAATVAALGAGACGGPAGAPSRHTLIDSRDQYDPRSLDPALSTDVPTGRAVAYIFDGLTQFTPDAHVEPALATRWELAADGRTYTFHLRQGVRFHDGSPFTARNVVASWMRALDPATHGGRAEPLRPIEGASEFADGKARTISGLRAADDSTVVVRLTEPLAIFPKLLAMPVAAIVPANAPADLGERPVGTGPWRFVEWKHDDYLLFARNQDYWGGAPKADSLRARIIAEPSTAGAEFEAGNVDVLLVPPTEARQWEEDFTKKPMLSSTAALELVYVGINTTRGPLRDVRVRRAINMAVDVPAMINVLVSGRGTRAAGVIPPVLGGYDSTRRAYPYDTLAARKLLAEAGYPNGFDVDLWSSTVPLYTRLAETMQAYLKKVGIRVHLVQREAAAARAAAKKGETDMIVKDWYADYPDAENFLYPLLHSANKGSGGNVSFYQNSAFDSIVSAARREPNDVRREAMYRQADSLQFADAPMLYLYFFNELYAVQPWVKGFRPPVIFNGQRWTDVSIVHQKQ